VPGISQQNVEVNGSDDNWSDRTVPFFGVHSRSDQKGCQYDTRQKSGDENERCAPALAIATVRRPETPRVATPMRARFRAITAFADLADLAELADFDLGAITIVDFGPFCPTSACVSDACP
jgi:hypothetical protein